MIKAAIGIFAAGVIATTVAWGAVGGGDINFSPKGAGAVTYSHESHVVQAKLKCSDCHYKIFQQTSTRTMTMAEMQQGLYCGACHNGQRAFDVKANCTKCHK